MPIVNANITATESSDSALLYLVLVETGKFDIFPTTVSILIVPVQFTTSVAIMVVD